MIIHQNILSSPVSHTNNIIFTEKEVGSQIPCLAFFCIMNCKCLQKRENYLLKSGVRQGCSLFPILFTLTWKNYLIRQQKVIKVLVIGKVIKLDPFTDDMTIYIWKPRKVHGKTTLFFFITQNNFLMLVYDFFGIDYCYINLNIASLFNCQL